MTKSGLGLLEVIVAVGIIVLFFAVITAVTFSLRVFEEKKFEIAASQIAQASLAKIQQLPFSSLTSRTEAPLTGITFNLGLWKTAADPDAPSFPNSLRLISKYASSTGGANALLTAPSSNVENGGFEAKIMLNSSPANSFAGLFFRSQDNFNYYRAVFNDSQIKFEKVVAGEPAVLWQETRLFSTTTFYKLKVTMAGNSMNLFLDDWPLTTVTDSGFQKGDLGIIVTGDILPSIDDVSIVSGISFGWNFDDVGPPELPATWKRYSLYELPEAQGFLTIEDVSSDLKKIKVRLEWTTHFGRRKSETGTLITSY